ncbi:DUF72 domain-containing protein, partial [Paenibacillus sepulcri]|nr:DUF72 domain-containing protein [Paenibacillus sepulcri]
MISIGLAGWGDHAKLYKAGIKPQERLKEYSKFFSLVEVDSSYYAIHKDSLYRKWAGDTSGHFSFVVKAYQGMTGHTRQAYSEDDLEVMFRDFRESIGPVIEAGKLKAVLFQYPPWFDCSRHNIAVLRSARKRMEDIPVALEFRHQSWFKPDMMQKTLTFMREEGWIHTVCDEPQVGDGSVPIVEAAVD